VTAPSSTMSSRIELRDFVGRISYEDYAVAMLDEVENPQFIRHRFTAAYSNEHGIRGDLASPH
jgi:hypothetical protein